MGILQIKDLILTPRTKQWCALPYPRHPKGCPNYWGRCYEGGRLPIYLLDDFILTGRSMWIIYNEFDLEAHMANMKHRHPNWSQAQLRNVYYWQNKSKSQLHELVIKGIHEIYGVRRPFLSVLSGEGQGVNLYATCIKSGLRLDSIKDMKICRHMVIVGEKNTKHRTIYTERGAKRS